MYATAAQMLTFYGAAELAQLCASVDLAVVGDDLFRSTVTGADRSSWSDEEVAAADEALSRLTDALSSASREVDGYLATRHTLPLAAEVVADSPLSRHVGAMARYLLYKDGADEKIAEARKAAINWLRDVATGRAVLVGASSPVGGGSGLAGWTSGRKPQMDTRGF